MMCLMMCFIFYLFLWMMWKLLNLISFLLINSISCDVYQASLIGEPALVNYDVDLTGG